MDSRLEPDQLGATLDQEILAKTIAPVHLEREAAQIAQLVLPQPQQGAPFPPEIGRRRRRPAPRARLVTAQQSLQGR